MALVTLEEAKTYLRVDTADEDSLIQSLLDSAEKLAVQVSRLSLVEWAEVEAGTSQSIKNGSTTDSALSQENAAGGSSGSAEEMDSPLTAEEIAEYRSMLKTAVMYATAYLYEHREQADHHELMLTLRSLLFSIREGRPSA